MSALLAVTLIVAGLAAARSLPAGAAASSGTPPPNAFILVDAGTGAVITNRNMHAALPPASTAKIMTALVAIERLPPDSTIPVSSNAANREAMKVGMQAGSQWSFPQAMASLMMVSANDAAYAVAEKAGGSVSGFAAIANATAKRYGMRDSTWGDPAGLTDSTSYDGGPHVSAYDLAIATRNALTVPAIARWADTRTYEFTDASGQKHSLTNHDKFLPDNGFGYPGANGFKTGFTDIAGHALVATAKRNGRQCIAVILGSSDSGYTWAASLLDQCWKNPLVSATHTILPPVRVSPYAARVAARAGFTRLAVGSTGAALAAPATGRKTPTSNEHSRSSRAAGTSARTTSASPTAPAKHHGGAFTWSRFGLVLLVLFIAGIWLRRRAVKRQRARRIARQRARAKAMRSGSLPVVDGRYRTGTRVGPPVESRVRVRHRHIDLTQEERPPVRRSRTSGPRTD